MSKQALLNVNQMAARKAAAELEFAVKKVHSLDKSKGGPEGYLKAIERRVEDIVLEEIKKFYPDDNFISTQLGSEVNNSNITWILKPIDGASNFLNGLPHFSLSLCSLVDNIPTTAVIIDPIRREEFSVHKGISPNLNNNKMRSSKQQSLEDSMLSFFRPSDKKNHGYDFEKSYKELSNQNLEIRQSGCLSLDLTYIASGRLDGMWAYGLDIIDIAAGTLIVEESGALVSNFNGDPKYLDGNNIICATSKVYKSILKSIKPYFKN